MHRKGWSSSRGLERTGRTLVWRTTSLGTWHSLISVGYECLHRWRHSVNIRLLAITSIFVRMHTMWLYMIPCLPNHMLVDLGRTDKVLEEYDNVLLQSAVGDNAFGLVDASSLLWRLEVSSLWSAREEPEVPNNVDSLSYIRHQYNPVPHPLRILVCVCVSLRVCMCSEPH